MGVHLSGTTAALGSGEGVDLSLEPGHWSITHEPAATVQATFTKAAVANTRHICKVISVSIACGATAQTPISVRLRDGITGVGTVLWSKKLSAPVNGVASADLTDLSIVGSVNTAMTIEFVTGGAATTEQTVYAAGVDVTGQ